MNIAWKTIIWQRFGAAIDMLDNALRACPEELWHGRLWDNLSERPEYSQFWYLAYHTLFWLDLYLSGAVEGFSMVRWIGRGASGRPVLLIRVATSGRLPN